MECYGDDDQFFMRHRKAPPSIDISILAVDASVGSALFDYGLTVKLKKKHSTCNESKDTGFNKSALKIFLFFYLFFSLFSFFIYGDSILSKAPTVILTAISIVVFLIVNSWLKS